MQAPFGNNLGQVLFITLGRLLASTGPCCPVELVEVAGGLLPCLMLLEALPGGRCRSAACLALGFLHSHMVTKDDGTLIKTIWREAGSHPVLAWC